MSFNWQDMIRFGRDLDALSSLGANFQDAFSGVNVASKCSQLPEVIRLFFVVYEDLSMSIASLLLAFHAGVFCVVFVDEGRHLLHVKT